MTPPRDDKNVDYELGSIQSLLEVIRQTLSEDRLASAHYRTEVRKQLNDHGERMTAIENTLKHQSEDIAEIKPKVAAAEERAMMSKGAANLAVVLAKAAHIISAAIGGAIVLALDKLVFHK